MRLPSTAASLAVISLGVTLPAIGYINEYVLQDTLKSAIATLTVCLGAFLFAHSGSKTAIIQFPLLLAAPALLSIHAFASIFFAHSYLASVEFIRWALVLALTFIIVNNFERSQVKIFLWIVHCGATIASFWGALQFWFDFQLFSQGPNPASTFVNRNFYAEYLVATIPVSLALTFSLSSTPVQYLTAIATGFNVSALLMTGTRSALLALILVCVLSSIAIFKYQKQHNTIQRIVAILVSIAASTLVFGSIPCSNQKIITERGPTSALLSATNRAQSIARSSEYTTGSMSARFDMWSSTISMIRNHPLGGVGAGSWEVVVPLHQTSSKFIESDYYAHNEFLQIISEYGIVGWIALSILLLFICTRLIKNLRVHRSEYSKDDFQEFLILSGLSSALLVSVVGFPWRLATTTTQFFIFLGVAFVLSKKHGNEANDVQKVPFGPTARLATSASALIAGILTIWITYKAIECEYHAIEAIRIASTIASSRNPNDTAWADQKKLVMDHAVAATQINPHYRKLLPIVADAMAGWGDWVGATEIWEPVLESRPYVIALMANVARGKMQTKNYPAAGALLERIRFIHPEAPVLKPLEVLLWSRTGREAEAAINAKQILASGTTDPDLIKVSYYLGRHNKDLDLTLASLNAGLKVWPDRAFETWLRIGQALDDAGEAHEAEAFVSFRKAVEASPQGVRKRLIAEIPPKYHARLKHP